MYFTMCLGRFASAHLQGVDTTAGMNLMGRGTLTVKPTPEQLAAQEVARAARAGGALAEQPRVLQPRRLVAERRRSAVGEDTVDWVKVFQAAKIGGLKNYFVEQDGTSLYGRGVLKS